MSKYRNFRIRLAHIVLLLLLASLATGCSPAARKARHLQAADRSFAAGNYDKARTEYIKVLEIDHENLIAAQRLGLIWSEDGAPLRAFPFLQRACELTPGDVALRQKLALALVAVGQVYDARKEAVGILRQEPANGEALVLLVETARTDEQVADADREMRDFPAKDDVRFHLASITMAVRKSDMRLAEEELRLALAADSKSSLAHLAAAYLAAAREDMTKAEEEFEAAAEFAPLRSPQRIKCAEFQLTVGAGEKAKAALREITRQVPDYLPAWRELAQIAFTEKRYDEALAFLENVFARDGQNIDALVLQADILMTQGNTKKAIEILENADVLYENRVPVIKFQLARAYLQNRDRVHASVLLTQAIDVNPDYTEAILELAQINLRSGDVKSVAAAMGSLSKKRPDLAQARLLFAAASQLLGRLDDAAEALKEQIRISPENSTLYVSLSLVLRQQNKTAEAREILQKALEMNPDNVNILSQIIDLEIADKNFASALKRAQQAIEKNPNSAATHYLEAKVDFGQKKWNEAEACLKKALTLDPKFLNACELLVSVYVATDRLPQAVHELEAFLSHNPDEPRALIMLALSREKMKDFSGARDAFEKLLVGNGDYVPALNSLAYLYADKLNQIDKAYEFANKARALQPDDPAIADTLGWTLYKRGDYQGALTLLRESAAKLADNPDVQFHLGMANYMMGQAEAARAALGQALKSTADFDNKTEAKRRMARLNQVTDQTVAVPIPALEAMVAEEPHDVLAWLRLGQLYETENVVDKAATAFERAQQLNPDLLSANLHLAQLNAGPFQNQEKALEFAKKARQLAPKDPVVAALLGSIAFRMGNFSWSYSLLQETVRQQRGSFSVLHDLAWAAYYLGKVSEARDVMKQAEAASPDSPEAEDARTFLVLTAFDQDSKGLVAAEPQIQKTLERHPGYVPALMAQAALQMQRGDRKRASEIYSEILSRYPDFSPADKNLPAFSNRKTDR